MRVTRIAWWCRQGHRNDPADRQCKECHHVKFEIHAQVHASERAVVYVNPATGERRTPPRTDMAMDQTYVEQGYERVEVMSMTQFERETGLVHEATNFNPGNEPNPTNDPPQYKPGKEVVHALAKDFADALASGPLTGMEKLL